MNKLTKRQQSTINLHMLVNNNNNENEIESQNTTSVLEQKENIIEQQQINLKDLTNILKSKPNQYSEQFEDINNQKMGKCIVELFKETLSKIDIVIDEMQQKLQIKYKIDKNLIKETTPLQLLQKFKQITNFLIESKIQAEKELQKLQGAEQSEYEILVQRLEAEIRQHIAIEQQMKLYSEQVQSQLEEMNAQQKSKIQELENQIQSLDFQKNSQKEFENTNKRLKQQIEKQKDSIKQLENEIKSYQDQLQKQKKLHHNNTKSIGNLQKSQLLNANKESNYNNNSHFLNDHSQLFNKTQTINAEKLDEDAVESKEARFSEVSYNLNTSMMATQQNTLQQSIGSKNSEIQNSVTRDFCFMKQKLQQNQQKQQEQSQRNNVNYKDKSKNSEALSKYFSQRNFANQATREKNKTQEQNKNEEGYPYIAFEQQLLAPSHEKQFSMTNCQAIQELEKKILLQYNHTFKNDKKVNNDQTSKIIQQQKSSSHYRSTSIDPTSKSLADRKRSTQQSAASIQNNKIMNSGKVQQQQQTNQMKLSNVQNKSQKIISKVKKSSFATPLLGSKKS